MVTYSSNAKNFQRLGEGDASAGSKYSNDLPDGSPAAKRRALVGCKSETARLEVAQGGALTEKDCNLRVIGGGETSFMLEALRILECDTCAYGIKD